MELFKNQYLITDTPVKRHIKGFSQQPFLGLDIHYHPSLDVHQAHNKNTSVLLLGIALDPYSPVYNNQDIANYLAQLPRSLDLAKVLQYIHSLSGRFVILYKNDDQFIVTGDACHFRQIYYGVEENRTVITSSPKLFLELFDLPLISNTVKTNFVNSDAFKKNQNSWYGNKSPDDRLKKLLPNHYLSLQKNEVKRFSVSKSWYDKEPDLEGVISKGAELLTGTYEALTSRPYKLIQPLTAGWDTRVLLAASKSYSSAISYYVFDRKAQQEKLKQDVRISTKLADTHGLNFEVVHPGNLSDNFIHHFKKQHIYPRILPKTENIESHWTRYTDSTQKVINLNGNSSEILRCFYGNYRGTPSLNMLLTFSGYRGNPFIKKELREWYDHAKSYAQETGINLLDLFYWEQRMGNWGAQFPYEQDIAIEEISPFNNRSLLQILYSLGYNFRKKPGHLLFQELIYHCWHETLTIEVNPDDNKMIKFLKRDARTNSLGHCLKTLFDH